MKNEILTISKTEWIKEQKRYRRNELIIMAVIGALSVGFLANAVYILFFIRGGL